MTNKLFYYLRVGFKASVVEFIASAIVLIPMLIFLLPFLGFTGAFSGLGGDVTSSLTSLLNVGVMITLPFVLMAQGFALIKYRSWIFR